MTTLTTPSRRMNAAGVIQKTCNFIASFGYMRVMAEFDGMFVNDCDSSEVGIDINFMRRPARLEHGVDRDKDRDKPSNHKLDATPYEGFKRECFWRGGAHDISTGATDLQTKNTLATLEAFSKALYELLPADWSSGQGSHGLIEISLVTRTIKVVVNKRIAYEEKTEYAF